MSLALPCPVSANVRPAAPDIFQAQVSWFVANGGECSAVRIGMSSHGRAIFAARPITAGETIIQIPDRVVLTHERFPREIADKLQTDFEGSKLAVLLLAEQYRGKSSPWFPYISYLPPLDELHSTIFWTQEELAHLQCSTVYRGTKERRTLVKQQFAAVEPVIRAYPRVFGKEVTFHDFVYTYAIVVSRAWTAGSVDSVTLRPFADFLNHDPESRLKVTYDVKKQATVIIADKDYASGDELCVSYGSKRSNAVLAVDYGFVIANNPDDEVVFFVGVPEDDPLRPDKLQLLQAIYADVAQNPEVPISLEEVRRKDDITFPQARAIARVISSDTEKDLEELVMESYSKKRPLAYLPRNDETKEVKAMKFLLELIENDIRQHEKAMLGLEKDKRMRTRRREIAEGVLVGELRVLQNSKKWL